ncbi:MAG: AmmeMemoRadiSam system protein B [Rhodoferax sp.]|nr:AmmeMemoRadiSam system protein B [Rhodoferax sp.]MBP8183492.1 AmmeMemoRadiSam system protein B [Rhodoferax sp.]
MHQIRKAAVAGTFYPGNAQALAGEVGRMLADASADRSQSAIAPKALIVPHAGYVYSGSTAAAAYATLTSAAQTIRRVVLLGPVHRMPVRGLAAPGVEAFSTPLGDIALDMDAIASLAHLPQVTVSSAAHAMEHSLEVQLPFLQAVLPHFKLVPLAVGDASAAEVAQVLSALWGGPETLIMISSDLSHFLPYAEAQATDQVTMNHILRLDGSLTHTQACGATPINGLLMAARAHHLRAQLLAQCNSGDTAGDRQRVVGYASVAFMEDDHAIH